MSSILGIVQQQQQQTPIDEDKLRVLCARKNVWDYFGLDREDFLNLSEAKQLQLVSKTCLAARKRTLIQVSEAQFKIRQDLA